MPADGQSDTARLSVFLPNRNHGRFLRSALDALLSQSVQPALIHVVDQGSTDDSAAVIEGFARDHSNVSAAFSPVNRNIATLMSEWLLEAIGDYVYFAAADDLVLPGLFEKSLSLLRLHPEAGLCSTLSRRMDENGTDLGVYRTPRPSSAPCFLDPGAAARQLMRTDGWMMGNTTIYRREALRGIGGFRPELGGFSDGFAGRVLALSHGACFVPEPLASWRRTDKGLASQTTGDANSAIDVADRAVALMTAEHGDVFPAGYSRRWRGRWLYGAAMAQLAKPRDQRVEPIMRLLSPPRRADRKILGLLARLPGGLRKLCNAYLALRLRPFDIPRAVIRLSRPNGHAG